MRQSVSQPQQKTSEINVSELYTAQQGLADAVVGLEEIVRALTDTLTPFLRAEIPTETKSNGASVGGHSPNVDVLIYNTAVVNGAVKNLDTLIKRLEV